MPADGVPPRAHGELLSAEEIARFVRLVAGEGITRVRLTGGEPLVSHRIIPLIEEIRAIPQIEDISLYYQWRASAAFLVSQPAEAGLDRVNISLDTLDPVQFSKITRPGTSGADPYWAADAALEYGFDPVKVNCVMVRRLNQDVFGMARLSIDRPVHVRFIEYMPIGSDENRGFCAADAGENPDGELCPEQWDASDTVPSSELRQIIDAAASATGVGGLEPWISRFARRGAGRLAIGVSGRCGHGGIHLRRVEPFLQLQPHEAYRGRLYSPMFVFDAEYHVRAFALGLAMTLSRFSATPSRISRKSMR